MTDSLVQEALAYLPTLALFSFVILASARIRDEMLLLACIPPVFVALIVGFTMGIYASGAFGNVATGLAIIAGAPFAWCVTQRLKSRDVLILIYLAWAIALVLALVAFNFPDEPR